jgi:hypothetical protein
MPPKSCTQVEKLLPFRFLRMMLLVFACRPVMLLLINGLALLVFYIHLKFDSEMFRLKDAKRMNPFE